MRFHLERMGIWPYGGVCCWKSCDLLIYSWFYFFFPGGVLRKNLEAKGIHVLGWAEDPGEKQSVDVQGLGFFLAEGLGFFRIWGFQEIGIFPVCLCPWGCGNSEPYRASGSRSGGKSWWFQRWLNFKKFWGIAWKGSDPQNVLYGSLLPGEGMQEYSGCTWAQTSLILGHSEHGGAAPDGKTIPEEPKQAINSPQKCSQ